MVYRYVTCQYGLRPVSPLSPLLVLASHLLLLRNQRLLTRPHTQLRPVRLVSSRRLANSST